MSISIHIPFYNPNPEKKEGYRNLRRFDYLRENVTNLKTLSIKNDIFIHTHNDFLDDKKTKLIKAVIKPCIGLFRLLSAVVKPLKAVLPEVIEKIALAAIKR